MYEFAKKMVLNLLKVPPEPDIISVKGRQVRVFRAALNYFRYRLYLWLIQTFIGTIVSLGVLGGICFGGFVGLRGLGLTWTTAFALAMVVGIIMLICKIIHIIFSYTVMKLDYEMRWYIVTDRSLRIREGIITVKEMTMSFANIQNISIQQGPLQRLLGISDLKVETAGGGSMMAGNSPETSSNMHTAFFRGVDNAEEIRELMKQRLKNLKDAGLGDHDDVVHESHDAESADYAKKLLSQVVVEAHLFRLVIEKYVAIQRLQS